MTAPKANGARAAAHTQVYPAVPHATKVSPTSSAGNLTPAQISKMKTLGIEFSEDANERQIKTMFWGATATRKTETVLRNFPNVLIIDAEGNTDQCVKNQHIPPSSG